MRKIAFCHNCLGRASGRKATVFLTFSEAAGHRVICEDCQAEGPQGVDEFEAIELWNKITRHEEIAQLEQEVALLTKKRAVQDKKIEKLEAKIKAQAATMKTYGGEMAGLRNFIAKMEKRLTGHVIDTSETV